MIGDFFAPATSDEPRFESTDEIDGLSATHADRCRRPPVPCVIGPSFAYVLEQQHDRQYRQSKGSACIDMWLETKRYPKIWSTLMLLPLGILVIMPYVILGL